MSEYLIAMHKEVAKLPELLKVKNSTEEFENIVGGEIATIDYEDFTIIFNKNNSKLRPNIYVAPRFLGIGNTIRGNILVLNKAEDNKFVSLRKEQVFHCRDLLVRGSFNYNNFDEQGKYIGNKRWKKLSKGSTSVANKISLKSIVDDSNSNKSPTFKDTETLKMLLQIQAAILQYLKNNESD